MGRHESRGGTSRGGVLTLVKLWENWVRTGIDPLLPPEIIQKLRRSWKIGAVYLRSAQLGMVKDNDQCFKGGHAFPDARNVGELGDTFPTGKWHVGKGLKSKHSSSQKIVRTMGEDERIQESCMRSPHPKNHAGVRSRR